MEVAAPCGRHHGNAPGLLAIGNEVVHLVLHGLTAHLFVGGAADTAQLQHIAQQGKAALAGIFPEHGQRGLHAVGVGVVAILNDIHASDVHHLLAHPGLLKVSQTGNNPAGIQPQTGGGAVGGQCIGTLCRPMAGIFTRKVPSS